HRLTNRRKARPEQTGKAGADQPIPATHNRNRGKNQPPYTSAGPIHGSKLNTDCDHYFRTVALSDQPGPEGPQISSERRLANARSEFATYLQRHRDGDETAYQAWLTELYLKIVNQLRVSRYEVESAGDVGVIFEVMNNRGKPLSELEKVKNYLLYAASTLALPNTLPHVVNDAWAEIFRQLMAAGLTSSADEDRLLRAHWLTAYDPQPRKFQGSKTIKERFDLRKFQGKDEQFLSALVDYTEGLRACCVGFCDAWAPDRAEAFMSLSNQKIRSDIKRWSEKLTRTSVIAPFLPLLIATRIRFANQPDKYLELVKFCELFAFRVYRILERRSDAGQADLFRIGHDLYRHADGFDGAMDRLWYALLAFSPHVRFDESLRAEDYNWYEWSGLKYFLYEYEEHLAGNKGAVPKIPWEEVRRRERADTIEHILPQTPKDAYWRERFGKSEQKLFLHDLGNLTLTKDNSSYSNKPFPDKKGKSSSDKPCYATSPFFMERELSSVREWNPNAVAARRKRLVKWARERWAVPDNVTFDAQPVPADQADYTEADIDPDDVV
ncbi:DUF262 domain-containing protein, partial [Mycolicibacterium sp. J2]|uniref:DUF262 domain-containing protein n=1 Tax=Mycolicibacterium sp. J2 TaxID=2993511 RepID=UPI00224A4A1C